MKRVGGLLKVGVFSEEVKVEKMKDMKKRFQLE